MIVWATINHIKRSSCTYLSSPSLLNTGRFDAASVTDSDSYDVKSVGVGNGKHPDSTVVNKPLILPGKHTDVQRTTQSNHVPKPWNAVRCHNNIRHQSLYDRKL